MSVDIVVQNRSRVIETRRNYRHLAGAGFVLYVRFPQKSSDLLGPLLWPSRPRAAGGLHFLVDFLQNMPVHLILRTQFD